MAKSRFAVLLCSALLHFVSSAEVFDITKYGGKGDGSHDNTEAIAKAISAASSAKGTVHFPKGTYVTGPIELKSNIILDLADGTVIKFSSKFSDYSKTKALIHGSKLSQVTIKGGVFDGSGKAWWDHFLPLREEFRKTGKWKENFERAKFFHPTDSSHITLQHVTFQNSPEFTVNPSNVEYLTLDNVRVNNPGESAPNTDGIHPTGCRHVVIKNCWVNTGDDGIVFTAGSGTPTDNVTVTDSEVHEAHGGFVIGTSIAGGVKNIQASKLTFTGTETGIRIKAYSKHAGSVENIKISNVKMSKIKKEGITITADYTGDDKGSGTSSGTPTYKGIHIDGVTGDSKLGIDIVGLAGKHFSDIELKGVHLTGGKKVIQNVDKLVESDVKVS